MRPCLIRPPRHEHIQTYSKRVLAFLATPTEHPMCLNLCNTLRTPRAREGHFRREAWDLHCRLPLFCLASGSRSGTRKQRKQQSATTSRRGQRVLSVLSVLYQSMLIMLCRAHLFQIVPNILNMSLLAILAKPSMLPNTLPESDSHRLNRTFTLSGQVALSLVTASGNSTPSCCSCEPSFTSGMHM